MIYILTYSQCSRCLQKLFLGYDETILPGLPRYLERALLLFYWKAAAVHHAALQRQSSIYVATETFICEIAGEHLLITAFAVLREDLEVVQSQSSRYPALMAAGCDLAFDYVNTGSAMYPIPLDDWLHGQTLVKHLGSERVKSAIWDMSRLPPGSHLRGSATFRWLQRSIISVSTR
jgi:hypothetical protein